MKNYMTTLLMIFLISIAGCDLVDRIVTGPGILEAAYMGNIEAVRKHIKSGTDLNVKDQFGSTPLLIAVTFGKTEVAKELIKAGADLNIANQEGSTPLITAAFFCRTELVAELLKNGADKNIKNKSGSTALETVSGPFEEVKPYYDGILKALGPVGLELDYEYIKKTRPLVAEMLIGE